MSAAIVPEGYSEYCTDKPGRKIAKERPGLSDRLGRLLEMIRPGNCLADIGTDHAYIPIEAVRLGICSRALACDIVPGPLARAEANIAAAGLSNRIRTRCGDGLLPLDDERPDIIVIAGMGGPLMERILTEGETFIAEGTQLVLSPQSELPEFRAFLYENGLMIRRESMVEEDGKFYLILDCEKGGDLAGNFYKPWEIRYGRTSHYREEDLPVRSRFIHRDLTTAEGILRQLEGNDSSAVSVRRRELTALTEDAKAALGETGPEKRME